MTTVIITLSPPFTHMCRNYASVSFPRGICQPAISASEYKGSSSAGLSLRSTCRVKYEGNMMSCTSTLSDVGDCALCHLFLGTPRILRVFEAYIFFFMHTSVCLLYLFYMQPKIHCNLTLKVVGKYKNVTPLIDPIFCDE